MFAVIETGGKQYKVSPGKKLRVEKLFQDGKKTSLIEGQAFSFDKVLLVNDDEVKIGHPYVEGVKVEAKVLSCGRAKKIRMMRYHSKTRLRRRKGHRQPFTEIEILKIH